jgi:uncharacterized protein YabE (DUF348 family)
MLPDRVPLPGDHPRSVWQPAPPRRQSPPPLFGIRSWWLWRILAGLLILIGGGIVWAVWQITATPITLIANGESLSITTHALTAGEAVREYGIKESSLLQLDPPPDTAIRPGMTLRVAYRPPVIVHQGDQAITVETQSSDPYAIVAEAGITLQPGQVVRVDQVVSSPAGDLPGEVRVMFPITVIVNEGGARVSFQTVERTLGEALLKASYVLYKEDSINPPLDTPLPLDGLEVTILRSVPVSLSVDGQTRQSRTRASTVGDLLGELNLLPGADDYSQPPLSMPITPDGRVRIVRVHTESSLEESPIPYPILYVPDPDLALDQTREIQPGKEGTQARRSRVRFEDGLEVSRVLEGEWISRQPQPRIIACGTRIEIKTLDTPNGMIRYWRHMTVLATSYSPSTAGDKQPGDARFGLSGTGAQVVRGVVAVDPRVIALGTNLYVPGYGTGRALDVGGAIKGLRIDLGYADDQLTLWNQWVDVYLLLPVPPPDEMIWVLPQ